MKKAKGSSNDELRSEYKRSDFGELVRGKYAERLKKSSNIVVVDPELSHLFPTAMPLTLPSGHSRRLPSALSQRAAALANASPLHYRYTHTRRLAQQIQKCLRRPMKMLFSPMHNPDRPE